MVTRVQPQRTTFKPIPYQRTNHRPRVPPWLVVLTIGICIGALGVLFLQSSYGPKRLSASESQKLTDDLASSNIERQRLQTEIDQLKMALEAAEQKKSDSGPATVNE